MNSRISHWIDLLKASHCDLKDIQSLQYVVSSLTNQLLRRGQIRIFFA